MVIILIILLLSAPIAGEATYYHPSLEGEIMRNGEVYHAADSSIAAVGVDRWDCPVVELGTLLLVCASRRCIFVEVQDTGLFPTNDIDLSPAAFQKLAPLEEGRIDITWYEITAALMLHGSVPASMGHPKIYIGLPSQLH